VGSLRGGIPPTADSYPYVTGMGFRNRSHLIYDEFHKGTPDSITSDGQVAFIKTDYVSDFFNHIMPSVKYKINIITHNSAKGIEPSYQKYLDNPNVVSWYSQNANFPHPKLKSIPLGLANKRWSHGNTEIVNGVIAEETNKEYLLYMNFDSSTNTAKRGAVSRLFAEKDYVFRAKRKTFQNYLRDLKSSKYSLSPEGRGVDCLRIWESILVGCVPIVKRCHNISFYEDMPILIVDDWRHVTKDFLEREYGKFAVGERAEQLYMDYWIDKVGIKGEEW